jgi:hypothetical protein
VQTIYDKEEMVKERSKTTPAASARSVKRALEDGVGGSVQVGAVGCAAAPGSSGCRCSRSRLPRKRLHSSVDSVDPCT